VSVEILGRRAKSYPPTAGGGRLRPEVEAIGTPTASTEDGARAASMGVDASNPSGHIFNRHLEPYRQAGNQPIWCQDSKRGYDARGTEFFFLRVFEANFRVVGPRGLKFAGASASSGSPPPSAEAPSRRDDRLVRRCRERGWTHPDSAGAAGKKIGQIELDESTPRHLGDVGACCG